LNSKCFFRGVIMSGKLVRWWKVPAAALACLAPVFGAAGAQNSAPMAQNSAPAARFSLDAATLRRYVGHYRVGTTDTQAVVTVALSGTQLTMQPSGGPLLNITPQSATHFVLQMGGVEVGLDFATDGKSPASALIVNQNGQIVTMPRMDDAAAARFNANLAARVQANTPLPGSQAAVNDWLSRMEKGQPPDYSRMAPQLAEVMKSNADRLASGISSLGALKTLSFQRVAPNGADSYLAQFDNGALQILIVVDSKGVISGLLLQPVQAPAP
jgi:hypothetical protein